MICHRRVRGPAAGQVYLEMALMVLRGDLGQHWSLQELIEASPSLLRDAHPSWLWGLPCRPVLGPSPALSCMICCSQAPPKN